MAELPRYWTREFVDGFVAALNASAEFGRVAKHFSEAMELRALDTPDGKDCVAYYRFERGRCVEHRFEEHDAPAAIRDRPFDGGSILARTTAPYDLWVKLDKGELSVLGALTSPDYKVEGPKLKIMWHVQTLNAMNAVAAAAPKRY